MKTLRYILFLAAFFTITTHSSCNKELDIESKNDVDASKALNTPEDVQALLVGCYTGAGQAGIYGGQFMASTELLGYGGDISFFGTYAGYTELSNKNITVTNNFVEAVWNDGFETINDCNKVLASLNIVRPVDKNRVEGEAKFLRGMTYFDLARAFGKAWNDGDPNTNLAVPLILTPAPDAIPANDQSILLKRETVAKVYAQAIADLTDAKAKLPASNQFYATKYAASAILSRIYLTQERFTEAETEASAVLANASYRLVANLATDEFTTEISTAAHRDNTTEDVFAIQVTNQSGSNGQGEIFASADFGGRGDVVVEEEHFAVYESGDTRADLFTTSGSDVFTAKFNNLYGNNKLVRLSEIYLNRAEARIRKSSPDLAGAIADINVVRSRSGLAGTTEVTQAGIFEAVKQERYAELAFEGFRLFDLKRYKESVGGLAYNSPKLVFPIPLREIQANPNLVQNTGY